MVKSLSLINSVILYSDIPNNQSRPTTFKDSLNTILFSLLYGLTGFTIPRSNNK